MIFKFTEVFARELSVINYRRKAIAEGKVARSRAVSSDNPHYLRARTTASPDAKEDDGGSGQRALARTRTADLTGIALSGGGIRSASFSLGVLQALDSLSNHAEPHVLDAVDYLSTVSGGGYIGTSMVAGLMQPDYKFPFSSKLGGEETPETQHLRDFSNFLAPGGFFDYLTSAVLVVRGLVVNAVIVLPFLLILAALTCGFYPNEDALVQPAIFGVRLAKLPALLPGVPAIPVFSPLPGFWVTVDLLVVFALVLLGSALFTSLTFTKGSLASRRRLARVLAVAASIVVMAGLFELQPFVLKAMFAAPLAAIPAADRSTLAAALQWFTDHLPHLAAFLVPVVTLLVGFAQRLANIAKSTLGEATWSGFLTKYASRAALYLAAIIVPFLLWVAYIYLSFWGIQVHDGSGPDTLLASVNPWLAYLPVPDALSTYLGGGGTAYLRIAIVCGLFSLLIGPNANSLHRLYRDRLSRAFLFERAKLATDQAQGADVDRWRFSSLKPGDPDTGCWEPAACYSPYLLVNTAINLEASRDLNKRGRNADTFTFSPLHIGSRATGYVTSQAIEGVVGDLSLATAMATSGAAASANMGGATIKILTFSLSLLNIRLGYWLANPSRLFWFSSWIRRRISGIGTWFFLLETLGQLSEKKLNVYLTDGGHIENLGIYELLQRRCKVIVAVDAEADPEMTFPSLVNLQVLARIDLGIRIDLPWDAIRTGSLAVTDKAVWGPRGAPGTPGPHAAIGKILYGENDTGVLIYIKSSLSGDESDPIRDYKRRNASFPHETTVDQFFSEQQFEAYRALGFHAARRLFAGEDAYGTFPIKTLAWAQQIEDALQLLNVPPAMARAVVARC